MLGAVRYKEICRSSEDQVWHFKHWNGACFNINCKESLPQPFHISYHFCTPLSSKVVLVFKNIWMKYRVYWSAHVCTFLLQNGALWGMGQALCGICESGQHCIQCNSGNDEYMENSMHSSIVFQCVLMILFDEMAAIGCDTNMLVVLTISLICGMWWA